ncbi:MAG: hypothetical protein DHS20C11_34420 [Lysobacteraceae bacterium]|nr:MAG: hypothetical protein DHS20C11_34420 [Xanthomonadaceae bacterium]
MTQGWASPSGQASAKRLASPSGQASVGTSLVERDGIYLTRSARIKFVVPDTPKGTPAVMT